ncbi:hypothetical protein Baya_12497 [Bagarius yarrelli]|uniref:Uncharacterized protein n=1 Tax=Bagarius yarrelli TaxID=175774 RepID=A0A556V8I6_BAGYA|nr:hypothetical protein Baya_12497 [Bagarius yarrelli]
MAENSSCRTNDKVDLLSPRGADSAGRGRFDAGLRTPIRPLWSSMIRRQEKLVYMLQWKNKLKNSRLEYAVNKGSHLGELAGWPRLWQLSKSAAAKPARLLFLFPTSTSSGKPLVRHIGIKLLACSLITLAEQRDADDELVSRGFRQPNVVRVNTLISRAFLL